MKISLEYVAMLKVKGPPSGSGMELDQGATASDLLQLLGIPEFHQKSVTIFINDAKVSRTCVLKENDNVFLSVPMSGG